MEKFSLFSGSYQKVLVKLGIILLVLFVIYKIYKSTIDFYKDKLTEAEQQSAIEDVIATATTTDNSSNSSSDTISDTQANVIADSLYNAMEGWGTDFTAMTGQLQCLNGASLKKVYDSFGYRDDMNLFSWFNAELSTNLFTSLVYYHDCVPNCDTYTNSCYQDEYMRSIWERSGIPINF